MSYQHVPAVCVHQRILWAARFVLKLPPRQRFFALPATLLIPVLRYQLLTNQVAAIEIRRKTNLTVGALGVLITSASFPAQIILAVSGSWFLALLATPLTIFGLRYGSTLLTRQKLNQADASVFISGFVSKERGAGPKLVERLLESADEDIAFEVAEKHERYYQRIGAQKVGGRLWVYRPC